MLKSLLASLVAGLFLTGCATTAPANLAFSSASPDALLIIAGPPATASRTSIYRRVDLFQDNVFLDDLVTFKIGGIGGTPLLVNSAQEGVSMAVKTVAPGYYALVEATQSTYTGYSTGTQTACNTTYVPVYEVKAGQITVIPANIPMPASMRARTNAELAEILTEVRPAYPDLKGDPVFAPQAGVISWTKVNGNALQTMMRNCAEPSGFEVIKTPPSPAPMRQ